MMVRLKTWWLTWPSMGFKDQEEFADDCDVGRVGALGGVVLVGHPFEESLE
jgi:hypothetical protein